MKILLATGNAHKAAEIAEILAPYPHVEVVTLRDIAFDVPEPIEDARTLEANAYIKAREIHDATGLPTLADDTGLEVDALDGAPGVHSARYAGDDATYADNCSMLLHELAGKKASERTARFRCVMCLVDDNHTLFAEGRVEGVIAAKPRGEGGFGYDPLFVPEGGKRTFAEMSGEEKNAISHRGRALEDLRAVLDRYFIESSSTP